MKVVFICVIHNKIKHKEGWERYRKNILRLLYRRVAKGKIKPIVTACDEC